MGYKKKVIKRVSQWSSKTRHTIVGGERGGGGGKEAKKHIFCLSCNNGKDKQSSAGYGLCQDSGVWSDWKGWKGTKGLKVIGRSESYLHTKKTYGRK